MPPKRNKPTPTRDIAAENFANGCQLVWDHPLFSPLYFRAYLLRSEMSQCPKDAWALVTSRGTIHVHPTRRGDPEEWAYVIAHMLLHLGFGHIRERDQPREWNAACDIFVDEFLSRLRFGRPPHDFIHPMEVSTARNEERIYEELRARGIPPHYRGDMVFEQGEPLWGRGIDDWGRALGEGLAAAVTSAVNVAGGAETHLGAGLPESGKGERVRQWFISSYPLLGALASTFRVIEDGPLCNRMSISVAAVDMESREIYVNPAAALSEMEYRFVMAHELLHVGLRHDVRCQGRDHYLWNIACDYVINAWLLEMDVGHMPGFGVLHDPQLKGLSAEAIYDRIVTDVRLYRKLATLRGYGMGDMLEPRIPDWWVRGEGAALDDFYRRALAQGLVYHNEWGRGLLPADLVEEINALSQPPIPWDVELAHWFDEHFPPLEKHRTYARPSRRQSSTPDIPRPRWVPPPADYARTFGVLLDTSGSMNRTLLAKALGSIASYSISRDVPFVRLVFCDAATYDQGYLPPEEIAGRVKVRGRGGTILQPGVDLLQAARDFPEDGPILIITDGACDRLHVKREHAFLLPEGRNLPFVPKGKVFRIR
jgi:predicted metal-dependent peptidase